MIFILVFVFAILLYSSFLIWCSYEWEKIPDKSFGDLNRNTKTVAVIVPMRNESENLPHLLKSLSLQNYPKEKFQIIISDDHSDDNSIERALQCFSELDIANGRCISSPASSKKNAINFGIENTDAEIIITTDADVAVGKDWISSIVAEFVTSNAYLICGPVKLTGRNNYFERLQSMEFSGLMGIGGAGIQSGTPLFCNGANLAFTKNIFEEVNGYGNSKSVSGDDTQLLLKVHEKYPEKIVFLKDTRAIVTAKTLTGKSDFWQQRKRWSSKIPNTLSSAAIGIAVVAWLVHFLLLIQIVKSFFEMSFLNLALLLTVKIISEVFLINSVGRFFSDKISSWIVITAQPFYCIYVSVIGILAPFSSFKWKGRTAR